MTQFAPIASLLVALLVLAQPALAQDIVVSPEGPVRSLSAAIQQAPRGGRIVVRAGVYREPTIAVDKPVTIIGEGQAVLDGEGNRQIMTVTALSTACSVWWTPPCWAMRQCSRPGIGHHHNNRW